MEGMFLQDLCQRNNLLFKNIPTAEIKIVDSTLTRISISHHHIISQALQENVSMSLCGKVAHSRNSGVEESELSACYYRI